MKNVKKKMSIVIVALLILVQVMETIVYAADSGTTPGEVVSNYSQLYSAIMYAKDGDVIGIDDRIMIQGKNKVVGDAEKHVTIIRMNDSAGLEFASPRAKVQNITFDGNGINATVPMCQVNIDTDFDNVSFKNCKCIFDGGGAINLINGKMDLKNCNFLNNSAINGGHVSVLNDSVLSINGCSFLNGHASQNGGAIFYKSSAMPYCEVLNSTIHNNIAENEGGGFFIAKGNVVVKNDSKLYGNIATMGEDIAYLVTGQGSYTDSLEVLNSLFAADKINIKGIIKTTDPDTSSSYIKVDYEKIVEPEPSEPTEPETGTDPTDPTDPSVPDGGQDETEPQDPTAPDDTGKDPTEPSQTPSNNIIDNSDHSITDDHSSVDNHIVNDDHSSNTTNNTNTNTTDNSYVDNSKKDNSSVVNNYYHTEEKESGASPTTIIIKEVPASIVSASEPASIDKEQSNDVRIQADGVNVKFEIIDGVYSIDISAKEETEPITQEEPKQVNWYEIIKILLLGVLVINVSRKSKV